MDYGSYFFDTSFLFAFLEEDDDHHQESIIMLRTCGTADARFFTNEDVLKETITLLIYRHTKSNQSIQLLKDFIKLLNVQIKSDTLDSYVNFVISLNKKISFQDASILFDAFKIDAKILSFDKELLKIEKQLDAIL